VLARIEGMRIAGTVQGAAASAAAGR